MTVYLADCESTGPDTEVDKIIEAAWLTLPDSIVDFSASKDPSKLQTYHQLFMPDKLISYGAMATHNIIPADLVGSARSDLFEFPDDADYLIGHNIDFDWRMFGEPGVCRICTLALSRWLFPELDSHKQAAMIYFIGDQIGDLGWARKMVKDAHSAVADVIGCAVLLRFLLAVMRKRGHKVESWGDLYDICEHTARLPTVMTFGKWKGTAIADVPADYVRWYRGTDDTDPCLLKAFARAGK